MKNIQYVEVEVIIDEHLPDILLDNIFDILTTSVHVALNVGMGDIF